MGLFSNDVFLSPLIMKFRSLINSIGYKSLHSRQRDASDLVISRKYLVCFIRFAEIELPPEVVEPIGFSPKSSIKADR